MLTRTLARALSNRRAFSTLQPGLNLLGRYFQMRELLDLSQYLARRACHPLIILDVAEAWGFKHYGIALPDESIAAIVRQSVLAAQERA